MLCMRCDLIIYRKALSRFRTDHIVAYLQFHILVCISADHAFCLASYIARNIFPAVNFPVTLNFETQDADSKLT